MTELNDDAARTEDATDQRRTDAATRGDHPISRDAIVFGSAAGIYAAFVGVLDGAGAHIADYLGSIISACAERSLTDWNDAGHLLASMSSATGMQLAPVAIILGLGGPIAYFAQSRRPLSVRAIRIDFSRLSPGAGVKRVIAAQNIIEFAMASAKIGAVALAAILSWLNGYDAIVRLQTAVASAIPLTLHGTIARGLGSIIAALGGFIVIDVILTQRRWAHKLKMTKQEVKDELKQSQGDRAIIGRRRNAFRRRISKPLKSSVPRATFILANPTHVSVALRYDRAEGGAPLVVAKGLDLVALRIRQIAEENGIPVVNNVDLARTIFSRVEIDQAIPPELYRAIADVLILLQKVRAKSKL